MTKDWIGSTSNLQLAVGELNADYQGVLHDQVTETVKCQEEAFNKLRKFEKEVGATSQQICKQIGQLDTSPIVEHTAAIEDLLQNIHKNINQCIDMTKIYEQKMPKAQRQSSGGAILRRKEFPNLYDYAIQTATPELIQLSGAKAGSRASVNVSTYESDDFA